MPIGMAADNTDFPEDSITLESRDRLIMFSDGLTDSAKDNGELYGLDRVASSVERLRTASLEELAKRLAREADKWRGKIEIHDDISIFAIEAT